MFRKLPVFIRPSRRTWSLSAYPGKRLFVFAAFSLTLIGCGASSSDPLIEESVALNTSSTNQQPVADSGGDYKGIVGQQVRLDGTGSSDPDDDTLAYQWTIESAPTNSGVSLDPNTTPVATMVPDVPGLYVVALGVTDGGLASESQSQVEVAGDAQPVANAGADQAVTVSSLVRLDGSDSTAPDNGQLSYAWTVASQPSGSVATLSDVNAVNPTFTPDREGNYVMRLEVSSSSETSLPDTVTIVAGSGDQAPIANAGRDQSVALNARVTLDGTNSIDPNGDALSYTWRMISTPSGSNASLSDPQSAMPTFNADVAGNYSASLVVSDGTNDSSADQVGIVVADSNSPPIAVAGADQSVSTGTTVTLNGAASSDPEGETITYLWRFVSRPVTSAATLTAAAEPQARFVTDVDGTFVIELIVNDGTLDSATDRVMVTSSTANSAPIANAGPDQNVETGSTVRLDGRSSSDADGDSLTYAWTLASRPVGSAASLSSSSNSRPQFTADEDGTYVLRLSVNDGSATSASDTVTVVASRVNSAPVANAGPNRSATVGETVSFDGRGSSDANGDSLSYQWLLTSRPSGSTASLSNSTAAQASLTTDVAGTYVASLTVNDGQASSSADSVTATITSGNRAPIASAGNNQTISTGMTATLRGNGSSDPDGDAISYLWSLAGQPSGSSASIVNATSQTARLTTDEDGAYIVRLIVNDGQLQSAADSVTITSTAGNAAPIANAGNNQTVTTGNLVQLSGAGSSDPDGDSLTYLWSMTTRPAGSSAALNSTSSSAPRFTPDVDGTYEVRLVVNDGNLSSPGDTVRIVSSTPNTPPVANAGANQSVTNGTLVQLNGNNSSDADGDSLTFNWSISGRPSGSSAALSSTTSATTTLTPDVAGTYTVRLVVNDGVSNSASDSVSITSTASNQAPVANAGANQSVDTGDNVTLSGAASSDPDGDSLTYQWTLTSRPSGSSAALSSTTSRTPSFTADVAGTYRASLVVSDGELSSSASTTTVTATTASGGGGGGNVSDTFSGTGPLLGYTTNNASALPEVGRVNGRYRAELTDNTGDKTLHYHNSQGRLDAKLVSFPFEYIARNIGIGTLANSQQAPSGSGSPYMFAGIQVHVTNLSSRNSSHIVVGHRGNTSFTIEGKNTNNGSSNVSDDGEGALPSGRADIRVVGHSDRTLTVYWRQPNSSGSWNLYNGDGDLPGPDPAYGSQVYIGLITYAFRSYSVPFVGTADSVELVGE